MVGLLRQRFTASSSSHHPVVGARDDVPKGAQQNVGHR